MADLETLTLQINTESQQASSAINKLAQRLDALSVSIAKLETGKLNDLANGLNNLNMVIQYMNSNTNKWDYDRIAKNISALTVVNTAGLDSLANSLTTLNGAISALAGSTAITDSLKGLILAIGKLGSKNVTNAIVNIPKLEKALRSLFNTIGSVKNIDQSIIDFTNSLTNLAAQGSKIGSATRSIKSSLDSYSTSATKATRKSFNLASAIGKVYAQFWIAMRAASGLKKAFTNAADYLEAYNYFDVVAEKIGTDTFRKAGIGSADEYADAFVSEMKRKMHQMSGLELDLEDRLIKTTNAKNLGLNLTEITQYQASIASITNSMGLAQETATATSKALSMLAADLGSLRNVDYDQVASNLQSAMTGMARSVYKYGIDLTSAKLEQYAYNEGIEKAVSEMSQAEKAQLRLLALLDQSKVAWGDLANTINSPANQLRMLKNNFAELGTVLGQLFIPTMQRVLPWINGLSIALKTLLVDIASLLGIELKLDEFGKGFSDAMEEDTESVDDLNKAMKETKKGIREFDELKVIGGDNSKAGSGLSDQIDLTEQILAATAEYERVWDEAYEQMQSKAQEIADNIGKALQPIKKIIEDFHVGDFFHAGKDVSKLVASIFDFFSEAIRKVDWEQVGKNIGEFIKGIKWGEILKSVGELIGSALQGALDAWKGAFSVAPFETALLSAFAILKFTGFGDIIKTGLSKALSKQLKEKGLSRELSGALKKLGVLSIGIGLAISIDNIKDIKAGEYVAYSAKSLLKSAISSLLLGAGLTSIVAGLGGGHLGLVFTAAFGISLLVNIIAAKLSEPKPDVERELAYQQSEWVRQKHLDTMEVFVNIDMRMGKLNDDQMNLEWLAGQVITLSSSYDTLSDASKELLKIYSEQLIDIMPELADSIDEVTGAYKGEREELDKLIEREKAHMQSQAYLQNLVDLSAEKDEVQATYDRLEQKLNDSRLAYEEAERVLRDVGYTDRDIEILLQKGSTWKAGRDSTEEEIKAAKNLRKYAVEWKQAQMDFDDIKRDWIDINDQYTYYMEKYEEVTKTTLDGISDDLNKSQSEYAKIIGSKKLPNAIKGTMSNVDKKIQDGHTVTKRDMNDMFNSINNSFAGLEEGKVPEEVQGTMDAIKQAIIEGSPELINLMAQLRIQMESAFENATLAGNGELLWNPNGVVTRIDQAFYTLESGVANHARMTKNDIKGLTESLSELFNDKLPDSINKSLTNLGDVIENGGNILGAIDSLKTDIIKEAQGIGLNVDLGVAGGVYSGTGVVAQSVSYMEKYGIETPLVTETRISSPSKKYRDLAEYIPEGVALGIEEDTPEVVSAMDDMLKKMQLAFSDYRINIPSLDLGNGNRTNYGSSTQYSGNNNALYEQLLNSGALNNGTTEVIFRVEGDPYNIFKVVKEQNETYRRRTHRSAFI